ncbi:MAG: hypothetical protein H0V17_33970, partial [Deltaproteobacteria bacterium]|nr:hypothetical protein [Deltaproteobacteria bacterium]
MSRLARVLVVVALVVGGCAEIADDRAISRWVVEHAGGAREVELPAHLDLPAEPATYVLRAEVEVPAELRSQAIELVIPHFAALASLRVDGLEAVATSSDFVEGYRAVAPKIWRFPDQLRGRSRVALELTVEHRWTQSAWLDTIPRLNRAGTRDSAAFAVQAINGFGAAFAVAGLTLI